MVQAILPTTPLLSEAELNALMHIDTGDDEHEAPIEIIFVDPHPMVLEGLKQAFERNPDFCVRTCVSDGETAWREILKLQPDIVVMELSLGQKDCLSLIRDLREERLKTLPVVFTHAHILDVLGLIAVGSTGWSLNPNRKKS